MYFNTNQCHLDLLRMAHANDISPATIHPASIKFLDSLTELFPLTNLNSMNQRLLGFALVTYSLAFIVFLMLCFSLSTRLWYVAKTRLTNKSDRPIEFTAIARNSIDTLFVLDKLNIFPLQTSEPYALIQLQPGEAKDLIWDWDDKVIHGFHITQDRKSSYMEIDKNPRGCCYKPSYPEYFFTEQKNLTLPSVKVDQALSKITLDHHENSFKGLLGLLVCMGILGSPIIVMGKIFVRRPPPHRTS